MVLAFCIKCGSQKNGPHSKCPSCGFRAKEEYDVVKSVWLSSLRVLNEQDRIMDFEPKENELRAFAGAIVAGDMPEFPEEELSILLAQNKSLDQKGFLSPLWFGFAFLIIPIIAIIVAVW